MAELLIWIVFKVVQSLRTTLSRRAQGGLLLGAGLLSLVTFTFPVAGVVLLLAGIILTIGNRQQTPSPQAATA